MIFFQLLKAGDYMKTITRTKYLDRIIELNGTPDIKIITGICRSGKSKLMQAYIEYLKSHFENINIIFIDFMDLTYEEIREYRALHAYVEEHYQAGKTNYLFVDEVQMCPKFELAINSLYSKGKYDIYVTGPNAFLLSADLATLFTGRYIEIHVFPFSFQEYRLCLLCRHMLPWIMSLHLRAILILLFSNSYIILLVLRSKIRTHW